VNNLKTESVEIVSEGYNLRGILTSSESKTKPSVVILHPHPLFGGNMENHVVTTLEQVFLEASFTTFRFNFRGVDSSSFQFSGINGAVIDTMNAVKFLQSNTQVNDVGIVGYSFGASTAMRTALLETPSFLISLSASIDLISSDGFDIEQLSKIKCPVLLFHGTSDQMIHFDDLAIITEKIKPESNCSVPLEGEGHFYQRSLPLVASTIRDFIVNLYPE